jgi:hypothetical protein
VLGNLRGRSEDNTWLRLDDNVRNTGVEERVSETVCLDFLTDPDLGGPDGGGISEDVGLGFGSIGFVLQVGSAIEIRRDCKRYSL